MSVHAAGYPGCYARSTALTNDTLRTRNLNRRSILGYHRPGSLGPVMQDPIASTEPLRATKHWTGLRATREWVDVALLGADGGTLASLRVPNDLRSVVRVVKLWARDHDFDPTHAVFCVEERSPWMGAVLERLLERGWEIVVLSGQVPAEPSEETPAAADLAELVRLAMRAAVPKVPLSIAHLRADKLERLRERRNELAALRSGLQTDGGRRNRHFEEELQREFERMDRRHMQLIDKLLARLDTLISLQLQSGFQQQA